LWDTSSFADVSVKNGVTMRDVGITILSNVGQLGDEEESIWSSSWRTQEMNLFAG
jgi:hypothetical protein